MRSWRFRGRSSITAETCTIDYGATGASSEAVVRSEVPTGGRGFGSWRPCRGIIVYE